MSISYKKNWCENCCKYNSGTTSTFQTILLYLLLILFIIPGILYYFLRKPSRCYICGLKWLDRRGDKEVPLIVIFKNFFKKKNKKNRNHKNHKSNQRVNNQNPRIPYDPYNGRW